MAIWRSCLTFEDAAKEVVRESSKEIANLFDDKLYLFDNVFGTSATPYSQSLKR